MRRTRLLGIVSILSGLLCAACSGAPDVDPDAAISSRSQPGLHVQAPAATRARERLTPVSPAMPAPEAAMPRKAYLVSSRATFREFSGLARSRGLHRDPSGTNLVISEIDATRLEDVAGIVHRTEQRCGGFFAFQTREEAAAFLRSERSAQALSATRASYAAEDRPSVASGKSVSVRRGPS